MEGLNSEEITPRRNKLMRRRKINNDSSNAAACTPATRPSDAGSTATALPIFSSNNITVRKHDVQLTTNTSECVSMPNQYEEEPTQTSQSLVNRIRSSIWQSVVDNSQRFVNWISPTRRIEQPLGQVRNQNTSSSKHTTDSASVMDNYQQRLDQEQCVSKAYANDEAESKSMFSTTIIACGPALTWHKNALYSQDTNSQSTNLVTEDTILVQETLTQDVPDTLDINIHNNVNDKLEEEVETLDINIHEETVNGVIIHETYDLLSEISLEENQASIICLDGPSNSDTLAVVCKPEGASTSESCPTLGYRQPSSCTGVNISPVCIDIRTPEVCDVTRAVKPNEPSAAVVNEAVFDQPECGDDQNVIEETSLSTSDSVASLQEQLATTHMTATTIASHKSADSLHTKSPHLAKSHETPKKSPDIIKPLGPPEISHVSPRKPPNNSATKSPVLSETSNLIPDKPPTQTQIIQKRSIIVTPGVVKIVKGFQSTAKQKKRNTKKRTEPVFTSSSSDGDSDGVSGSSPSICNVPTPDGDCVDDEDTVDIGIRRGGRRQHPAGRTRKLSSSSSDSKSDSDKENADMRKPAGQPTERRDVGPGSKVSTATRGRRVGTGVGRVRRLMGNDHYVADSFIVSDDHEESIASQSSSSAHSQSSSSSSGGQPPHNQKKGGAITGPVLKPKNLNRVFSDSSSSGDDYVVISSDDDDVGNDIYRIRKPSVAVGDGKRSRKPAVPSIKPVDVASKTPRTKPKPLSTSVSCTGDKPVSTASFLSSLDKELSKEKRRHEDAIRYVHNFKVHKEHLVTTLFALYNQHVFDNRLPTDFAITWNVRLLKTAGHCYTRREIKMGASRNTARVELSSKVCDSADRVRDTLIHELCHAAAWIINGYRDGHGPLWNSWAVKARHKFSELPIITRCHSYAINTRFIYECVSCGNQVGRHSKSIDTAKKVCGRCHGSFELMVRSRAGGAAKSSSQTPARTPNKFALFVKENYASAKIRSGTNAKHGDVMKLLSTDFAKLKC